MVYQRTKLSQNKIELVPIGGSKPQRTKKEQKGRYITDDKEQIQASHEGGKESMLTQSLESQDEIDQKNINVNVNVNVKVSKKKYIYNTVVYHHHHHYEDPIGENKKYMAIEECKKTTQPHLSSKSPLKPEF